MADSLVCFSSKGKRLWHVDMPSPIMCLEDLTIEARGVQFTAVALRSKHVLMLNDKHIVDWFSMPDAVSAMRFGKFGREDSSLVLITVGGSLTVKILRRTAQFENMEAAAVVMGPNARQVTVSLWTL